MRPLTVLTSLALLPLLGGCVIYSNEGSERVTVTGTDSLSVVSTKLEPLSQVSMDGQRLTVRVGSNGCTQVSSFEVQIVDGDPAQISLIRREPDLCRALVADGVSLSWTYEELGLKSGQAAQIVNPLTL
ncbi:hypothetical protein [Brevundimonas vesicularis]|uniref:hypothetical protein n=1 Tax=Brevundimonas vesicularis TaxID=41276 RepID=UPI0038D3759C